MRFFFAVFLLVPLIEIYFLIKVGGMVGAGMTVLLVVFTAFLGAILVRAQGFSTWARVQQEMARGQVPAVEMLEGLCLFVAGALLLTPGFFTDTIGFLLLTPPLRRKFIISLLERRTFHTVHGQAFHAEAPEGRVIDVEYHSRGN